MEIEGTYTLPATPAEVWHRLLDRELWSRTISGIERAEQVDTHAYRVTVHLNQPALTRTYTTRATITEQRAPYYCRFTLTGDDGQADTLDGYGILHLNQQENHTVIAYKGLITSHAMNGMATSVSPLVMKGAIKLLLEQFFTTLAERVDKEHPTSMNETDASTSTVTSDETFIAHEQRINIPSPLEYPLKRRRVRQDEAHSRLRWFVHLLHIGKGNLAEEIRWAQRIRRFSIASVLLFLVWVGTRIPRR